MAEIGKDLIVADELNVQVLFTPEGLQEILKGVQSKVKAYPLDVTTDKGRAEIASLAYKIARTKTLIDNLGKEIIADWQAKVNGINSLRKTSRDFLDNLKGETRNPLDEWEEEQKKIEEEKERNRKEKIQTRCHLLSKYRGVVPISLIETMPDEEFDALLLDKKEAYEAEEAEKAEQERVRKEQERIRREQEAKEAALKAEQEDIERKRKEQKAKEAALEQERERLKLNKIKAEEEAAKKIEREKKEAAERKEFERQAKIREKKEAADRIEFERQAKIKAEKEAAEKIEREKKEAAERAKREAELKPDKAKLREWIDVFNRNPRPSLKNKDAQDLLAKIAGDLEYFLLSAIESIRAL